MSGLALLAGAGTLAELVRCETPAILIPYPLAANDHQRANARWLGDRGAAIVLEDSECTGERLAIYRKQRVFAYAGEHEVYTPGTEPVMSAINGMGQPILDIMPNFTMDLALMIFIMPTIFLVVGGPAALRLLDAFYP